ALVGAGALVFSFAAYAVYRSITGAAPGAPASTATPVGRAFLVLLAVSGLCAIAADWAQAIRSDPGAWGTAATVTITASWIMLLVGSRWFRRGQWRPANRTQRRQFQFMKWGAYVSFGPALVAGIVITLAPNIAGHQGISWLFITVGFFPLILAYAISREQLFGFSGLLRRSLQYAFFSGGLGVVFLVSLGLLGAAASYRQVNHQPAAWLWVAFAGAIVLSRSARKPLHDALDRRFFREAYQAEQVLGQLGAKLSQFFQREEMETYFLDRLAAALHPAWAAIYTPPEGAPAAVGHEGARRERLYLSPYASPGPEPPAVLAIEAAQHLPRPHQPGDGPWVMGPADPDRAAWGGADVVAPLGHQHEVLGWLLLGPKLSEEPYVKRDLDLLSAAGGQLAQGLTNAALLAEVRRRDRIGQELQMARAVQQRLLPRLLPSAPGLEIAVEYAPAREVGGDYYDAFELRPNLIALALADVAGKGFAAALLMANLQALVRAALRPPAPGESPATALSAQVAQINRDLHRSVDDGQFATLFAAVVDTAAGAITYCNAGHELPLYFLAGAAAAEVCLDRSGLVLGLFPEAAYEAATAPFPPGSWLLIFTDGATDAMNSREESFSREQLETAARLAIAQPPENAGNADGRLSPALAPAAGPPSGMSAAPAVAASLARNLRRKIEA
ncbi:MAG: PP2C family protein-serine/threonine phosphatase, partial [Terriglobales bacterium]